jgi:hypothetical protein
MDDAAKTKSPATQLQQLMEVSVPMLLDHQAY